MNNFQVQTDSNNQNQKIKMEILKITYEKAQVLFNNLAFIDQKPKDPLTYACGRTRDRLEILLKEYTGDYSDLCEKHALLDKDGGFITDGKDNYKIDPKKITDFKTAVKNLNEKEVEFTPYKCTLINNRVLDLNINLQLIYNGFLFDLDLESIYAEKPAAADPAKN